MENSDNCTKRKNTKERASNTSITTNDSPFATPSASPTITPNNESFNINIMENRLNNYKLPVRDSEKTNNATENTNNIEKIEIEKMEIEKDIKYDDVKLDTLILNLKIISKLKPGYKLSLKKNVKNNEENNEKINGATNGEINVEINDLYIDNSYFQYLYRIFSDNSREHTTKFLETLDNEITKKIEELVKKENYGDSDMFLNTKENILLNLSHNLNLSLVGLNNLINTYANDDYVISKIEMIINNFELKIRKISNILKVNK